MSFNGSGTFVVNTAGQPVVPNTVISATAFNALTNDLANGLSTCITKDGQTTPTANIPMGNNKITGLAPGTSGTDAANLSQVQGSTAKLLQSVTGTDTITAAMVPALTSYSAGQMFYFVAAGDNTGAVTINIDSLGAKSVTRDGSTALVAGDIVSGEVALIVYDGTRFQLLNGNSFTNLNVSNNLTLSGGTANGVLYLNGSKVATSGSALTFDGTNLGIGTASPGGKLEISLTSTSDPSLRLRYNSTSVYANHLMNANGSYVISSPAANGVTSGEFLLQAGAGFGIFTNGNATNTTPQLTVNTSGNLGLGVTPSAWSGSYYKAIEGGDAGNQGAIAFRTDLNGVELFANSYFDGTNNIYKFTGAASLYQNTNGVHSWSTAPSGTAGNAISFTQAMTLDADGQLLLGTTSTTPITGFSGSAKGLTVQSSLATIALVDSDNTTDFISWLANSGGTLYLYNKHSTSPLVFGTNNAERGRFSAGGYFKASNDGTYVDSTGTFHELRGGAANGYTAVVSSPVATPSAQYVFDIRFSAATPNDATARFLNCTDATATRAYIRSNGGLSNYQANDTNLSDERVKTDIAPLGPMWAKIKALEIVTFKYKDQTHDDDNIGLIAQQVEAVAPEFVDVDGWGDTPEDGVPLKSIYTADMYHAAIKALQEAMARIESLEAKVAALEAK